MQNELRETLEEASRNIRVMVVSEHAMARAGIAASITIQPDMQMVGEYDSCRTAWSQVLKTPPDAIVIELSPGGGDVLDNISRCHSAYPDVAHIVISQTKDSELAERAIKAGAKAVVYKSVGSISLAAAIRDALQGNLHVCRCIASPMLQKTIYGNGKHKTKHPELGKLSDREFQVFQLIGAGWDNQKIAEQLGISVKTLNVHKEHLKDKLKIVTAKNLKRYAGDWRAVT